MVLFKRRSHNNRPAAALAALGCDTIALRLEQGEPAPAAVVCVLFDAGDRGRRVLAGHVAAAGETAYCFHPGPYSVDLTPYPAAPELGLRLQFVIDAADPRVDQQRFDLYLFSEVAAQLTLLHFGAALQSALQVELAQGNLELGPCTALDEWHRFRAGLNQLLYTRFGVTVEDCLPVDLAERVDFAALLAARAVAPASAPVPAAAAELPAAAPSPLAAKKGDNDASAMRRLFLELPALSSGMRQLALPAGQQLFQAHQRLLQRLDLLALDAGTMPSLAWAAPDRPLEMAHQRRRARHSAIAVSALDEGWALLARFRLAADAALPPLLDEADRILSNLELQFEQRRMPFAALEAEPNPDLRREPT